MLSGITAMHTKVSANEIVKEQLYVIINIKTFIRHKGRQYHTKHYK